MFFQQPRSVKNNTAFWKMQWGKDLWFSQGSERWAGVITLKNKFNGNVIHSEVDPGGHYVLAIINQH